MYNARVPHNGRLISLWTLYKVNIILKLQLQNMHYFFFINIINFFISLLLFIAGSNLSYFKPTKQKKTKKLNISLLMNSVFYVLCVCVCLCMSVHSQCFD